MIKIHHFRWIFLFLKVGFLDQFMNGKGVRDVILCFLTNFIILNRYIVRFDDKN